MFGHGAGGFGDCRALGGDQIRFHAIVKWKDRRRRADLRAHVGDRRFAGRADRPRALAKIFDNIVGAALHRENSGDAQNNVFCGGPAVHFTFEMHADEARPFQFPRNAGHHIHRIRAADTDGNHAKAAGIGRVRIRADHHAARKSVIFQHDLVDDAGARIPKADAVFVGNAGEKFIHLLVLIARPRQIRMRTELGLNQMIAMHRARHDGLRQARAHELQQRHLRRRVLHGHAIR
ncbi:MAG: hypothetical protein ALAOOOJD_03403 [bacterium]|nr:hypothetical protein [bacterium]